MLRYLLTALTLKAFSVTPATRMLYRKIGNVVGSNRRQNAPVKTYVKRGNLLVNLTQRYSAVHDGGRLLEIGTGWIHWYSLFLRLFYDANITMFDVWDNRQLEALKAAFQKLSPEMFSNNLRLRADDLEKIISADCFDQLYQRLGLNYVIEPRGSLQQFPDQSFDCVFSFHVLEHIPASYVDQAVSDYYRLLRPGGYSIHQIGIDDHLTHYDRKESPKNYLRFSDRTWKLLFQNDIQYFNRLQMSDWLKIFNRNNLQLEEKFAETCDISRLNLNPQYKDYDKEDLSCKILTIVHRKP